MGKAERIMGFEMMRRVVFCMTIFLAMQLFANQIKVVQAISGSEVTVDVNKKIKLLKNTILKDEARFRTSEHQFIKVQLGSFYELSILDQTDVFVDLKTIEGLPNSYIIHLNQGQIYLKNISKLQKPALDQTAELNLKTVFFDWKISSDQSLDLMIDLKAQDPLIRFCQRDGEFQVSLFDHEKKISLKTLEGVEFQGVRESHQVAYDILLKGRKIPKGKWLEVQKCSFDQILQKESDFVKMEQLEREVQQKKDFKMKQNKQKADSKYLCHVPYGQLNECAWVLKAGRCQKTRCNAEGKWTGSEMISISEAPECKSQPFVSKCDN
jgi:hypothetical protein